MAPHLRPLRPKNRKPSGNCRMVDRDEYFKLLLSFNHLVRADDPARDLRGLHDTITGITYLIEREKLSRRPVAGLS